MKAWRILGLDVFFFSLVGLKRDEIIRFIFSGRLRTKKNFILWMMRQGTIQTNHRQMANEYSLRVAFKVLRIPTKFLLPNVRYFEVLNQWCPSKNQKNPEPDWDCGMFNGIETSGIGTERFPKKKKLGLSQFGPDTFSRVVGVNWISSMSKISPPAVYSSRLK